jgi:hypothetical protein
VGAAAAGPGAHGIRSPGRIGWIVGIRTMPLLKSSANFS